MAHLLPGSLHGEFVGAERAVCDHVLDAVDATGTLAQRREEVLERGAVAFGLDFDGAVGMVRRAVSPWRSARPRTYQRKPTPCTWPNTVARRTDMPGTLLQVTTEIDHIPWNPNSGIRLAAR